MKYLKILNKSGITFDTLFKTFPNKGNLVYEYNPLRNYRLSEHKLEYNNSLYTLEQLKENYSIKCYINGIEISSLQDILDSNDTLIFKQDGKEMDYSEYPVLRRKGELVDFETNELQFDLNHPVSILPQYSYDNSVNLIINDGKNYPKLINSRFSATERNQYHVVDRKGNNDTNIYDQGSEFDIDTSLIKKTKTIPNLKYYGTFNSGNMSIGNYHFYFKYLDADGNESDFFMESGLVSIFVGETPYNIHTGVGEENSHKGVSFLLKNLDSGYQYISIYYTKATSDIYENTTVSAFKIEQRYLINTANMCNVKITGYEEVTEIPVTDINLQYQIFSEIQTQAFCQNRLFFGNTSSQQLDYQELSDISLRFIPYYSDQEEYNLNSKISPEYEPQSEYNNSYYNSRYIYDKVGYWPGEIYRFGIVYIMNDGSLTPVFNVRGVKELKNIKDNSHDNKYVTNAYYKYGNQRKYISYNEETYLISSDEGVNTNLENSKGVVRFPERDNFKIYGVAFKLESQSFITEDHKAEDAANDIIQQLSNLGVRGYFFVRQKRIPTILCQALTIGIDKQSHTPVIPFNNDGNLEYISELFLSKDSPKLTHDYLKRTFSINRNLIDYGAICPEYDVDYPYYNTLFSGDIYPIGRVRNVNLKRLSYNPRFYYDSSFTEFSNSVQREVVSIQGIEDNQKLAAIDDIMFSARAGESEEVFRFEYAESENKTTEATNLIRGSFGPFLGLKGTVFDSSIVNIYIPGYKISSMSDYYAIRYNDKSSYYAISDKISLDSTNLDNICYRGDCYICQFTHRLNRNFQDPSAPTNDTLVDPKCWEDNWKVTDGVINTENIDKINLGDVNAIQLGQWITFAIRSSKNLNIRTIDSSNVDEKALTGICRGFYPYYPASTKGMYKIPEALCCNKGFEKSVSERWNYEAPDVPAIKNDFSNRISYSDLVVTDAFQNGARIFRGMSYRDYPKTYGSIIKLVELRGNLLCVFEHGIGLIPVNERVVAGEGSGGTVFINTSNVLPENPKIISDTFGSQWKDSIIKTPRGVYGVDTIGKKIWRTNGEEIDFISDFKVQEFLNQNISLTERELLPVIGVRNVKTHYNKYKGDVMFTFYDNLYGFEERVWNLCYNENLQRWVTFYSWVPSYSENIYNQYFSFDRNTSKWITKLGVSKYGNDFSDGVTLDNVVIEDNNWSADLHLSNRNLPIGTGVKSTIEFELVRDNYKNHELFEIVSRKGEGNETIYSLKLKAGTTYDSLKSELYERNPDGSIKKDDERGIRIYLDRDKQINPDKIVRLLNIRAKIKVSYDNPNGDIALGEVYASGYNNKTFVDQGYYESVVAVIPKYNMQFLTTDFWKHGQAGIIDIADKIAPTYWYGKQHPFEFEFVVADNPQLHKIFDNLQIISNKAAPESFHYEIVGECYEFAKDKKNMYIRQEATKELYQFNGSDIVYNPDYKTLDSDPRPMNGLVTDKYEKSTIFPLYYRREDTINEIEDYYHLYGHKETYNKSDKNFSALSGAEIVRYPNLGEYRIWNHAKAVDIHDFKKGGRMRGNMQYKEDKWDIQINPLNLVQRNESQSEWTNVLGDGTKKMVPAECNLFAPPDELYTEKEVEQPDGSTITVRELNPAALPSDWERNVVSWGVSDKLNKEVKLKDKYIKIRVRYSGKDLAVISALKTLYSISYA